jgi:signal peptidase I
MRAPKKGSLLREIPIIVISALVVSVIVKTFFIHFFFIPSGSMENTLQVGDRIAVNKLANFYSDIKRGEVVVFRDPANWLGAAPTDSSKGVVELVKSGLVTVGVLPDPAKQYLIKRTIGVGGDTIKCCNTDGKLTVNGVPINEPYIFAGNKPSDSNFTATVPQGYIWVMGDHRGASADSRFHTDDIHKGMVPLKDVVGRAVVVVWPFTHMKFLSVGEDLSKVKVNSQP